MEMESNEKRMISHQDSIQKALAFYQQCIEDPDIPQAYRQLMQWYCSQSSHNPYEEALDLMHVDEEHFLPRAVFSWLETFFAEQAAARPEAWNDLGVLYYSGRAGVCDLKKARECYEKGDQAGDLNSSQNLGYLYLFGQGMPANPMASWYYFTKGALAGMPPSMLQLARMMEAGSPCPQDLHMAYRLYERLYEEADPDEECSLWTSVCLGMGRILEQIPDQIDSYLTSERLYQFAISNAEGMIDAQSDPVLYKELKSAESRLKKLESSFENSGLH